jgi:hypothetical protein
VREQEGTARLRGRFARYVAARRVRSGSTSEVAPAAAGGNGRRRRSTTTASASAAGVGV